MYKKEIEFKESDENGEQVIKLRKSSSYKVFTSKEIKRVDYRVKQDFQTQMMKLFYENAQHGIGNELKI